MRIVPSWLFDFLDLKVDVRQLAADLTLAGIAVESIGEEDGETVFEMDLTTNRVDAMNHYGVARECSAIYDLDLKPIAPRLGQVAAEPAPATITIAEPGLCARYTGRAIRNVKVGPSPAQVASRLTRAGSRPINNAADATNYTLLEMGHPTHAFDFDLIEGKTLIVRLAKPGESIRTLDGVERKLTPEDLIIADARRPVAIAGVMGGWDTMITEKTRNVLIEAAWFDPASVRRTARRLVMHTDASHRFERGADYNATSLACDQVAELIMASGGGQLQGPQIDTIGRERKPVEISFELSEIRRILGQEIPEAEVRRILSRLGFGFSKAGSALALTAPGWRSDVTRDIDLVEEIARIYGFNRFANTLPAFSGGVITSAEEEKDEKLRAKILALGYDEIVGSTFISAADAAEFAGDGAKAVPLENPLSEEAAVMRTSLVPGMLDTLARNLNRGATTMRLSEAGHVFVLAADGKAVHESPSVYLAATGCAIEVSVHGPARAFSFFDLKEDVNRVLAGFETGDLHYEIGAPGYYHPGRSARVRSGDTVLAYVGQLHPRIAAARKIKQEIFLAELLVDKLYRFALRKARYRKLSRYPAVERDFSFFFNNSTTWEQIEKSVASLKIEPLTGFAPCEIFRGGSIPASQFSLLARASFQSLERTLRDEEVAQWSEQIVRQLESLGGRLRAQ